METRLSAPGPKQAIYESLAEVAQALGHANRLELLELLAQGARAVEDLAAATGMTFANTSRHLQILRRARLAETERQGKRVLYSLTSDAETIALMKALGSLGERNIAEVNRVMSDYFNTRDAMEPVSRKELSQRIKDGAVTILDVRPEQEFALGHVPGAINMPMKELKRRLAELPKGREIVAYCRGPYCVMSFEAVAALRTKGYRVRRMEDGFPEWKAAGHKVEVGVR